MPQVLGKSRILVAGIQFLKQGRKEKTHALFENTAGPKQPSAQPI